MRRVNSSLSSDDLILEDLETEGERQLKSLLQHQLDTSVTLEQCLSKKRCFAPATVYRPFGEEAAGTLTLTQFQSLQESDKETASLRELGLTDSEIVLWKSKGSASKISGLGAAPEAVNKRLSLIEEKISEHSRILSLPQRFAGSKQLNRREMEIENALFQGEDRHSFLKALYYQDETQKTAKSGTLQGSSLDAVYNEIINPPMSKEPKFTKCAICPAEITAQDSLTTVSAVEEITDRNPPPLGDKSGFKVGAFDQTASETPTCPIVGNKEPLVVTEHVEFLTEEAIRCNCLSEDDIRKIPRFASYSPGHPSKVLYLKNLSPRVTPKELFSLFARFQKKNEPAIQFRVLTGRMRGQAFITFPSVPVAQEAWQLANGYNLLGKPLVIEFGKNKSDSSDLHS
ncbi:RNA-binding protein 41 [Ambystoma mexicanum]|uniref:RNA-binding protein 41 n=1 Tax=Ambystoma mexicanum TaxID=8296 RepID=UPI0037E8AF2C